MVGVKHRYRMLAGTFALVAVAALTLAASARAVEFPTACTNTVNSALSDIPVEMTANSPASVMPGDTATLSSIEQSVSVPPDIFLTGYALFGAAGLITPGLNEFPTEVKTVIEGSNTVEGTQETSTELGTISTTITDPDGVPGTEDDAATPGEMTVTYDDQTWTTSGGTVNFRMDTQFDAESNKPDQDNRGLDIKPTIGGVLTLAFRCSPGVVEQPEENSIQYDDPAAAFATTQAGSPPVSNEFSIGKPKLNKKKGTAKLPVEVPGPGKVVLVKTSKVKNDQKTAKKAGTAKLKVRAANKAKLKLKKRGKAKVKAKVKYTPDGGESATKSKQVQLKLKKKKKR